MKKRMISLCMAVVLLFAMVPQIVLNAGATEIIASGICGDNLTWTLDGEGTFTISGSGDMYDYAETFGTPWNNVYGDRSEYLADKMISVVVKDGVTSIGNYAFSYCGIKNLTLSDSVTRIGNNAFEQCALVSLSIPGSVTSIGNDAFSFGNFVDLTIPGSVSHIGDSAFVRCENLQSLTIQEGVSSIGGHAFSCCYSLGSVSLPESLTSIGDNAFYHCESLKSIDIPKNVTEFGEGVFQQCTNLDGIWVDINNPSFFNDEYGVLYNAEQTMLIQAPGAIQGEYIIPDSVINIGYSAFDNCSALTSIVIPDCVNTIGGVAFRQCSGLTQIELPKSLSTMGSEAFWYCENITELTIPEGVSTIGFGAFCGCKSLSDVIIPDSVLTLEKNAFTSCSNLSSITFIESSSGLGNAPTFDAECFGKVTATAYYPVGNSTWDSAVNYDYGGNLTWVAVEFPNYDGFWLNKDGWSFANSAQSFAEEPTSHAADYFIPRERYDALYGKSYVDSQEKLFTTRWGGNCAGMSATAILFFLDNLNWESIDVEYAEDFSNPNDFYRTVNLHNQSQSYYPAIGNDTEVTRLIEAYQLYINAIDKSRLVENLDNTYFADSVTEKKSLFGSEYIIDHVPSGTYIASMLEEFQEAYEENNPLFIVLQSDGFGHGIVARTDLKPKNMGDGWWRVYVYDPNKPYVNQSVSSVVSGVEAEPKYTFSCNTLVDNGGDIYLELNPSLNQWRYCTSVNSNSSDSYIGSSPSGEILWKTYYHDATPDNENDDEVKKNNAKMPDFFYTIDLTDLSMEDFTNPHFNSTNAWIPENDLAVAVDGNTDCSIYASTGELVAIVEDGDAFVLTDVGSYDAYIGQTEDGDSIGGKIYLPNDVYTVYYTSGAVQFLGNDNALSFSFEGAAELTVDIVLNSLQILAQEDGIAAVKCTNVTSTDECSYVDTEGTLVAGETFTIAYSDENKVEASTDSKDGEFQLYQKDANQEEAVATKVIKSSGLWWLWIVGGVAVAGVVLFILLRKKKPNA